MGLIVYAWGPLEASSASPASSPTHANNIHGPRVPSTPASTPNASARRPLPSVDPACLAAITFLSLANANFSVIESNDPALSESGALPVLRDETSFFHGLEQVLARKSDRSLALDADLTPAQRADALAVKSLVVDKLNDVLQFAWFIDPRNSTATSSRFSGLMSLPSRWVHMRSMRKAAVLRINARAANEWAGPLLLGPVSRPTVRLTPTAAVSASEVAARAAEESATSVSAAARHRSSGTSTSAATFGTAAPRSGSRTPAASSDRGQFPEEQGLRTEAGSDQSTRSVSPLSTSPPAVAAPLGTFKPPTISLDDQVCVLSVDDAMHIARRVYATLATLLGDRPYLFGDRPHSLDAIVFGYLALHYYPILSTDANGSSTGTESASSTGAGPQSLALLLLSDFPTLVAYLDRVYAAARISAVKVERPLPNVTNMLWTTAKDALMGVPRALTRERLLRSGLLQTVASVAMGVVILVGYVAVVKASEARQVAEAVQYAQAVARQRKLAARNAEVHHAGEPDEDEDEEHGMFAGGSDDEDDNEYAEEEDEYFDDDDDDE